VWRDRRSRSDDTIDSHSADDALDVCDSIDAGRYHEATTRYLARSSAGEAADDDASGQ
jgi:hypothetical protein